SALRLIFTGGGPLGEYQLRSLIDTFKCRVAHGGGGTEPGVIVYINLEEHLNGPSYRLGSAGISSMNSEIRVIDDKGNDVMPGEVGELIGKGETIMKGYWNRPEETEEVLRDGWFYTGDLVRIDEEMYITYVDRKKDMIKSGGENVFSKEVEDMLYSHPAVLEAAVIGVPDEKWGEAIKALIILKEGKKTTEEEIIAHCRGNMASFKCPKSIEFYKSFPKTGLNKIAKNILRDTYWKGFEKRVH
ncbi:MAG: AMP-binding protein, partial [Thermodesulfobacteriota bacterium]|nr:AMP-binding protein [Thermodesulfobacteriota bacterium]